VLYPPTAPWCGVLPLQIYFWFVSSVIVGGGHHTFKCYVTSLALINNDYIIKEKLLFLIGLYDLKKLVNHPSCHLKTDSITEVNNLCVLTRNIDLSMLLIIQHHRIREWSGLEGTSVGHLVQPPRRSRVTYSRLHRTLSRWVLSISREGDSTTSLGSLFWCSITLRVKKFFMFMYEYIIYELKH